jgi:hypothetical protein
MGANDARRCRDEVDEVDTVVVALCIATTPPPRRRSPPRIHPSGRTAIAVETALLPGRTRPEGTAKPPETRKSTLLEKNGSHRTAHRLAGLTRCRDGLDRDIGGRSIVRCRSDGNRATPPVPTWEELPLGDEGQLSPSCGHRSANRTLPIAAIGVRPYRLETMRYGLTLCAALSVSFIHAASLCAQSNGQIEDLSNQIIIGASGNPIKCNSSNARQITFADAATMTDIRSGDCVAVVAYWKGRALFASSADANSKKSMVSKALEGHRVGIYGSERMLDIAPRAAQPFKIVGSYASCKTEWPGAMLVLGYCHFSDGPFLKITQAVRGTRRDVRLAAAVSH